MSRPALRVLLLLLLPAVAAAACRVDQRPMHAENPPGRWYVVADGETLPEIARRAGVPAEDLLEVNGLESASQIRSGKLIFVLAAEGGPAPSAAKPIGAYTTRGDGDDAARAPGVAPPAPGEALQPASRSSTAGGGRARLRWPVEAPRLTSHFGARWGRPHEGIDLSAPTGTPVLAADAGEVIYAGNAVRGYGNMIVLRHATDLLTVYAHNSVLLVKPGDRVAAGQRVALSGQSGHATAPHVHFEVRLGETPRDPLLFLPERTPR